MRFVRRVFDEKQRPVVANIGSASHRLRPGVINLDLFPGAEVDVQGDIHSLPFRDGSIDAVVCTGVLEHVEDADLAVREIERVLVPGGAVYVETPWMQGVHASPSDFRRWTPEGIKRLFAGMEIEWFDVAVGPTSALAWQAQEAMAHALPVVASRVGGVPEVLPRHGDATLVEPEDAGGLAFAIVRALQQGRYPSAVNRKWAMRFEWEHNVVHFEDIYRELVR